MIVCDRLSKTFGGKIRVNGVSFEARHGEVLGIVGPNGAGKTTTLRMILGLTRPSSGTVTIDGKRFRDLPFPLRSVGVMLDGDGLNPTVTPRTLLESYARSNRILPVASREVLSVVGLHGVADRPLREFSLGMRKRVCLALALLGDPTHLITDEPLNGLDPHGIVWMRTLLRNAAADGRCVVVASHLLSEQERICDRLVVMNSGRVVTQGTTAEVVRRFAEVTTNVTVGPDDLAELVRVIALLPNARLVGSTATIPGDQREALGRMLCAARVAVLDLSVTSTGLEGAFNRLVSNSQEFEMGSSPEPRRLATVTTDQPTSPTPRRAA